MLVIIVIIVIAVVAAVLASSSLSKSTTGTTSSLSSSLTSSLTSTVVQPGTLVIDDVTWPNVGLNQLYATGEIPYPNWLDYSVYQGLVTTNGTAQYQNGQIQILPMLASNWTVSSDGMTYTFMLRQNVTFSNGDPLNAYQVWGQMYGFYYLSANSSNWLNGYGLFDMGSSVFGPSVLNLMNQSGLINPSPTLLKIMTNSSWPIYAAGPNEIVFRLAHPFQSFTGVLVQNVGLIFDTQYVLKNGGFGTPVALNPNFNLNPIPGTGPYVVTSVTENSFVKFTQNPNYWGRSLTSAEISANPYLDPGHVKNVILYSKTDDLARYVDLSTGTAQIAGIQSQDWQLVQANPSKYSYFVWPQQSSAVFTAIAFNTHRYPTNITAVRQAIVHAINYSDISQKVFFGGLSPMMGPEYPVWKQYYDLGNLLPYQFNTTLAQQILKQTGIDTAKLPPLEFRVISGCNLCVSTGEIIQEDLANIGLNVQLEVTIPSSYTYPLIPGQLSYSKSIQYAGNASHLVWFGTITWASGTLTPADQWVTTVSNRSLGLNWATYYNPVVQACDDSWTNGSSSSTIISLCTKAQSQIYNDVPYIWLGSIRLFFGGGSIVWDKSVVKGFLVDPIYSGESTTFMFNTVTFVNG